MLLLCTPLGFIHLFDVVGQVLVKPQFLRDINEDFCAYSLEEESVRRRLRHAENSGKSYVSPTPMRFGTCGPVLLNEKDTSVTGLLRLRNGELKAGLEKRLEEIELKRKTLRKFNLRIQLARFLLDTFCYRKATEHISVSKKYCVSFSYGFIVSTYWCHSFNGSTKYIRTFNWY